MINLQQYGEFVSTVMSDDSKNIADYEKRITELQSAGCKISQLDTAACGLSSEAGEFMEIVKKIKFQGKPYDKDTIFHMKRELGDVIWYWSAACTALGLDPDEIIQENVNKLVARYPGGVFNLEHSENRKDGDL